MHPIHDRDRFEILLLLLMAAVQDQCFLHNAIRRSKNGRYHITFSCPLETFE